MSLSLSTNNKIFLVVGIIFELWFILMYAIDYEYLYAPNNITPTIQSSIRALSIQGLLVVVFLLLLFFLGFTLVNTYVAGSAYSSGLFSFMIIVFTIQYYFIIRSFWVGVGLGNDNYVNTLGDGKFKLINMLSTDYRLNSSTTNQVGFADAITCSLAILIAYMAIAGRVGSFQVFSLCFFGVFFYSFNETAIWRHQVADNGYTMRIFLYGSSFGLVTAFILRIRDKLATTQTLGYFASRHTRTYGLLGAIFVWLFLPILSAVGQLYFTTALDSTTYLFSSILTTWFALSGSACASFCFSILLGRKIHPHDIVFSSFTGGIAWGATSTLNPDPFPALLIGLLTGAITTLLNHKLKKPLNNPEVIDTQGTLFTFFTSAFIGGVYSAIMSPIGPFGVDRPTSVNQWQEVTQTLWLPSIRDRFGQGGFQIAATFWSIAIGAVAGIAVGLISYLTTGLTSEEAFIDNAFAELTDQKDEAVVPQRA